MVEWHGYVHSRTGMTKHGGKTPFEVHYGYEPFVGHLRNLGCPAFAAISKDDRPSPAAFADRVKRCVFVGYPLDQPPGTYMLLNLETRRLITSRNVYFDERFLLVSRDTERSTWTFLLDAAPELSLTFATSDEIEHAYDAHMSAVGVAPARGSVGDDGDSGNSNRSAGANNDLTSRTTSTTFKSINELVRSNPRITIKQGAKRRGTVSGDRYSKYCVATDVAEYLRLGGKRGDLRWDISKGIVTVLDADTEYFVDAF